MAMLKVERNTVFNSPFDQYKEHNGQPFTITKIIRHADCMHDYEVLPMFEIEFPDGEKIEAWPEEIYHDIRYGIHEER